MAKELTAAMLIKSKADPSKRVEIPDGVVTGLYFIIQPTGRKSWAVRYRSHGRPRKVALGNFLAGDDQKKAGEELKRMRAEASDMLERARQGDDPAAEKQIAKKQAKDEDAAERTKFDRVARTFLARHAKPNNRSWKETARTLGLIPDKEKIGAAESEKEKAALAEDPMAFKAVKKGIADKWGHRPITDITRAEIIALLDDVVDRGAPIVANRTLAALRKLFNWAISRDLIGASPCTGVKPPAVEKARDRVLTDDELKAFWKASGAIGWPFGPMFKTLLLTGQRREEVAGMMWREIEIHDKNWIIPRERVKTDKVHDVPLNAATVAVLESVPKVAGAGYVFTTTGQTPASGISKAKERLDAKMLAILQEDDEEAELPAWRLHDLRRTVASGMARLGINLPVIEKILNHTSGSFGGIVGVYQRHEFAEEKRRALDTWGSFVETLVSDKPSNVVSLARA
ncbi:tyrosine-type recombinase/integrase [Sinorhizobium fredii]|uniref:tyrosine-type recombinase/integrase n=1 Tax=Rhizobium fredii TaxID=380 RepID=UPI00309C9C19